MDKLNEKRRYGICFMQEDKGRDTEIVLPIVYAAEQFLNCTIDFELKWNAHLIYKKKPDFVIIPANCIGSKMYHDIAKYANQQGIKIFSFISEGNFNIEAKYNFFGFNDDFHFYQDYVCAWSQRTLDYIKEKVTDQKNKIVLTGASGFDRFKIYEFEQKDSFLKRYNKTQYNKIVSYAGWAFGKIQYEQGREELEANPENRSNKVAWVESERIAVRDALKHVIESNPDILFVLKQHPAEYYPGLNITQLNEMSELVGYENVLYLQGQSEGIHDVISIADIVLGFESTSAIETWIMGDTPTIFINRDVNFQRVNIHEGCLIAKDGIELNEQINTFYKTGTIAAFFDEKLLQNRERIIESSIGFKDGLNHLRHLKYLNKTLNNIDAGKINYQKSRYFHRLYLFFVVFKPFYKLGILTKLPWFSKFNWVFERYKLSNIYKLKQKYKPYMEGFYKKEKIDKDFLYHFFNH